ncbi:hypothetical protein CDD82_1651 [Ophiocordyceps australis]|uniref:Uncharacterized protein n=1 Tax=Ophiocordyceps australis TaxID=1399860 RepID=A0A2C5XY49_9HYPO|nr:hypothetical protein CDD82_1651 [Ophiocordyceps australis]
MAPYKDLAPTRFEVFPPLTGRRADRVFRPPIPRPPAHPSRTPGPPASRPRARRSAGSSVRRASGASRSRPRSGTVRRKTGGTGRGPGRWPKGTKKSDYGNADSGPGLPPGWREKQARLRTESDSRLHHGHMGDKDEPAQDEVQVVVAKAAERDDD